MTTFSERHGPSIRGRKWLGSSLEMMEIAIGFPPAYDRAVGRILMSIFNRINPASNANSHPDPGHLTHDFPDLRHMAVRVGVGYNRCLQTRNARLACEKINVKNPIPHHRNTSR